MISKKCILVGNSTCKNSSDIILIVYFFIENVFVQLVKTNIKFYGPVVDSTQAVKYNIIIHKW